MLDDMYIRYPHVTQGSLHAPAPALQLEPQGDNPSSELQFCVILGRSCFNRARVSFARGLP